MTNWTPQNIPKVKGEFWTRKQRQMHSLHYAISYRASFKPELPEYCIRNYSCPGDIVADPFCGRGTTALQANLLGRAAWSNDISPLATAITYAKTKPVPLSEVASFLDTIDWQRQVDFYAPELAPFYHPDTLRELYILKRELDNNHTGVACFVRLLALSRLHGHSSGFFSAYSMPQLSVSPKAQQRINKKRGVKPEYREVAPRIKTKAKAVLRDNKLTEIRAAARGNRYSTGNARNLREWPSAAADLVVTSPPFLNTVNYLADNWLEHWFLDISSDSVHQGLVQTASISLWAEFMLGVLQEIARILRKDGYCIIEVGEVLYRKKVVNLDELLLQLLYQHQEIPLQPEKVLIHVQDFTKLAHCFSVTNNKKGTNTHRLLVLQKK